MSQCAYTTWTEIKGYELYLFISTQVFAPCDDILLHMTSVVYCTVHKMHLLFGLLYCNTDHRMLLVYSPKIQIISTACRNQGWHIINRYHTVHVMWHKKPWCHSYLWQTAVSAWILLGWPLTFGWQHTCWSSKYFSWTKWLWYVIVWYESTHAYKSYTRAQGHC